jgi:hypothetical protein
VRADTVQGDTVRADTVRADTVQADTVPDDLRAVLATCLWWDGAGSPQAFADS